MQNIIADLYFYVDLIKLFFDDIARPQNLYAANWYNKLQI